MSANSLSDIENRLHYLIELDLSDEDLLEDPLALALYLLYLNKHDRVGINKAKLVNWARTFCYEVLVERKISKKRDTEITSAILLATVMQEDEGFSKEKKQNIKKNIPELIAEELDDEGLFFGSPTLSAVIVYSLQWLRIADYDKERVLKALLRRYKNAKTFNSLLGLIFLVKILIGGKTAQELPGLIEIAEERLRNQKIDYDDYLYLVAALFEYYRDVDDTKLVDMSRTVLNTINHSPILISWVVNEADIPNMSPGFSTRRISRLYKAVFLDLLESYKDKKHAIEEDLIDRKYRGSYGFRWFMLIATPILVFLPSATIWKLLQKNIADGIAFWVFRDTSFSWPAILINTGLMILFGYAIVFGVTAVLAVFKSLVIRKLESEKRVFEHLARLQKRVLMWYLGTVVGGLIIGTIIQLIMGGAIENKLTG